MAAYDGLVSKHVASRASLCAECASELDTMAKRSRADSRGCIDGSDDSPVSSAKIWGSRSSKHASKLSNPDPEPSTAKCGVQIWAGMNSTSGEISRLIS